MSAHLRPIRTQCYVPGCLKTATEALHNTYNAHIGNYCSKHAKQKLKEVLAEERRLNQ